jgi:formylglycine-generating enzyme required for sulfatase activity
MRRREEECQRDGPNGPYQPGLAVDPLGVGEGEDVRQRVVRGGFWSSYARLARSAYRGDGRPGSRGNYLGFRVARGRPVQQDKGSRLDERSIPACAGNG